MKKYILKLICTGDEYVYNMTVQEARELRKLLNKGRLEITLTKQK